MNISEIENLLEQMAIVEIAKKAYEEFLTYEIRNGNQDITKYKITKTNGRRFVIDQESACQYLKELGFSELINEKTKGLSDITKKLGKDHEFFNDHVEKTEGGEKLKHISEKGEPIIFEPIIFEEN